MEYCRCSIAGGGEESIEGSIRGTYSTVYTLIQQQQENKEVEEQKVEEQKVEQLVCGRISSATKRVDENIWLGQARGFTQWSVLLTAAQAQLKTCIMIMLEQAGPVLQIFIY